MRARSGAHTVENLLKGGFGGPLYAVNPGYATVCGVPCFPSLAALPEPVEHVIFAVSDARVEAALDDVIAHGARAVTLMSSLVLAKDSEPTLRDRVAAKLRAAGLLACGANGMGFYNFADGIWGCGFRRARTPAAAMSPTSAIRAPACAASSTARSASTSTSWYRPARN